MKVGVWLGDKHEVLYDSTTDEVVFREIFTESPVIVRISFKDIIAARIRAHNGDPEPTAFASKEAPTMPATRTRRRRLT